MTFRSYETEKDDIAVSVEIPTIEMITEDTGITVDGINQEILARYDQSGGRLLKDYCFWALFLQERF